MTTLTNADQMMVGLQALYPSEKKELSRLLQRYEADNPGFNRANWNSRKVFYETRGIVGRSAADIERLFWQSPMPRAVGLWKASAYSGSGAWKDLSGKGHDFTFPGGAANPTFLKYDPKDGKYAYCPGVAGNHLTTPDSVALSQQTNFTFDIDLTMDDWTPAANQTIFAKFGGVGQRSYALTVVATTGILRFAFTTDGTTQINADSTAAPVVADGARLRIRVTRTGASGNIRFWTSPDGVTWTQLGSTVVSTTGSIFDSTQALFIGNLDGTNNPLAGKFYSYKVYNSDLGSTSGSPLFDLRANDMVEPFATVAERVGAATVTAVRAASGKKLSVVDRSLFLFGTDDYLETPDHNDFDFALTDSFTVVVVERQYGSGTSQSTIIAKRIGMGTAANVGWGFRNGIGTPMQALFEISDGTNQINVTTATTRSSGVAEMSMAMRDVSADRIKTSLDGTVPGTGSVDPTTATIANVEAVRIGRLSGVGTGYMDNEVFGVAVLREALSAADLTLLQSALLVAGA